MAAMYSHAIRIGLPGALLLALAACTGTEIEVTAATGSPLATTPMQPDADNSTLRIPQIDREVPKDFQTATFALG